MDTDFNTTKSAPNPRMIRALQRSSITGNHCLPVDTLNSNILVADNLPLLPHIKKRKLTYRVGNRSISYQLRFLYLALREMAISNEMTLSFATVHFSDEFEKSLLRTQRKPASNYGEQLIKSFSALPHPVQFFLVLERGKKGEQKQLHSHMVLMHHPDDVGKIKEILRGNESNPQTGVRIGDAYEQTVTVKPGSFEQAAMELDREHSISQYKWDEKHPLEYVREYAVNIGSADYMSKQLTKMKRELKSSPIFAPQELRIKAKELYVETYDKQQLMKAKENALKAEPPSESTSDR